MPRKPSIPPSQHHTASPADIERMLVDERKPDWRVHRSVGRHHAEVKPGDAERATFDQLDFILRFEEGRLESTEQLAAGFQHLIDTGIVWQLQGVYGRTATDLIRQGLCHPRTGGAL